VHRLCLIEGEETLSDSKSNQPTNCGNHRRC
jgi:hypothetical protein